LLAISVSVSALRSVLSVVLVLAVRVIMRSKESLARG